MYKKCSHRKHKYIIRRITRENQSSQQQGEILIYMPGLYLLPFSWDIIRKNTAHATKGTHPYAARPRVFVYGTA